MGIKKELAPELKFEDLKVGQVYRSKRPKMIGIFDPVVDDRQILFVSPHRKVIEYIDHGYTPEFEEWCKKPGSYRHTYSNIDQEKFEAETGKAHRNIEAVWDYTIQYDSPSVKNGKNYPTIPASKFIKWAAKNVTEIMPKGDWANKL